MHSAPKKQKVEIRGGEKGKALGGEPEEEQQIGHRSLGSSAGERVNLEKFTSPIMAGNCYLEVYHEIGESWVPQD